MVKTRQRRAKAALVKPGTPRQGQELQPQRSLRVRPKRTEKWSDFQSSQKQKRRKKILAECRKSPVPSLKINPLSPTTPRFGNENKEANRSKRDDRSPFRKLSLQNVKGDDERIGDASWSDHEEGRRYSSDCSRLPQIQIRISNLE